MGLCLIAALPGLEAVVNVLLVVLALGMVIFVHELGHFLVAKLCGVKCEKFYLGFDIFGWKICKFTRGDTEYGVGILPLGGYVKMLGQEDNPARLREELERAEAGKDPAAGDEPIDLEAAKRALYDPRSYLAQSVPERMAIISAGVIMNVIFALVMAVVAFGLGVRQVESSVGDVVAGDAAWQLDIQVGDRIEKINGKPIRRFTDLKVGISLGDNLDQGITLTIQRPDRDEPFEVTAVPDRSGNAPTIGVGLPSSTTLRDDHPAMPGSSAAEAKPALEGGDQIVAIDGKPVGSYAEIYRQLAQRPDETLEVTVRRKEELDGSQAETAAGGETLTVSIPPRPMLRVGLVMEMGPIVAVQRNSPAAAAGFRPGDSIRKIDGNAPGDPMTLPDRLRRRAGENPRVTLSVARQGQSELLDFEVTLRTEDSYGSLVSKGGPVSVASLGIAYQVENTVAAVAPGSPADAAKITPGDVLAQVTLIPPDKKTVKELDVPQEKRTIEFSEKERNWPFVFRILQTVCLPGTRTAIQLQDGRGIELVPVPADDWFNPDRGLLFDLKFFTETAATPIEAVKLGFRETVDSLTMVFRTLHKLSTQQVSPKLLGGPVMIAKVAYYSAKEGPSALLVFLCLISANLAVLNFLPIPVLDGGHMVFLAYEGIRRKPPSEAFQVWLSYLGLAMILALMIWVIGLDFGFISRQ